MFGPKYDVAIEWLSSETMHDNAIGKFVGHARVPCTITTNERCFSRSLLPKYPQRQTLRIYGVAGVLKILHYTLSIEAYMDCDRVESSRQLAGFFMHDAWLKYHP